MQALENLGNGINVALALVPGHMGIQKNESTWQRNRNPLSQDLFCHGWNIIWSEFEQSHANRKREIATCRQAEANILGLNCKEVIQLKTMIRGRKAEHQIRLFIGHGRFEVHYKTVGLNDENSCRHCGEVREDSLHILWYYSAPLSLRLRYGASILRRQPSYQTKKHINLKTDREGWFSSVTWTSYHRNYNKCLIDLDGISGVNILPLQANLTIFFVYLQQIFFCTIIYLEML